ncbi:uncharacterized protein LOC120347985 [Styela clava]
MKILCAGFWKTGTKSLAQALKILGYKVYDYDDQLFHFENLWKKFFDGTVTDEEIREQLADVDVFIDGPVIAFWEEIHRAIPETKVILSIRDEDSWFKSYTGMMAGSPIWVKPLFLSMFITPTGHAFMRSAMRVFHFCQGVEGPFVLPMLNLTDNPRLYKAQFRRHNCHVIHTVQKDKLLVFQLSDSWEPLCRFLGKKIPEGISYPHKNKLGAHFKSDGGPGNPKFQRAGIEALIVLSIIVCVIAYLLYALVSKCLY